MTDKPTIVYLHESVWESWGRDFGSMVALIGIVAVGWLLGSSAMQWLGFVVGMLWVVGRANSRAGRLKHLSPQEAADWLAEKYNVRAKQ